MKLCGIENRVVSELSDKTIFHVVLNIIIVISIVSDETIFYVNQRSQSSL